MDNTIKLIVHRGSTIFDSVIVTPYSAIRYEQKVREKEITDQKHANTNKFNNVKLDKICLSKKGYNAYFVSVYVVTVIRSQVYRKAAFNKLLQYLMYKYSDKLNLNVILMKLRTPKKQFLDYKWNERITQMALERREINHAMSWLSTLGGAFSALGDEFHYCAEVAGKISIRQFQLALRLGDPLLVARCKLYSALSLIQQGDLDVSKKLIINIYKFSLKQNDVRLQNMCQGIWAKLKYCYKLQKERHKTR
ncbi:uncharacterized protein F58A4.6 [Hylaeus anthracinus]|uniref:uncharacterized protein F58A4.6 n=1 Tax=Hylaeus anthracinus TaxID=313031 RepID=UPI0023BA38C9|nr:uncharacterized protein F58A4.6 [Hylaeus anthracinus]